VRAVFSGHEHLYWREKAAEHDQIEYFVAGGAGAPAYASPDHGGFAHYLVVRVPAGAKPDVSYDVIEPGRLYVEPDAQNETKVWLVNSNDAGPLTLGAVRVPVPASLGSCDGISLTTAAKGVTLTAPSCVPGDNPQILFRATGVPAGASVPVILTKKN
jgi:hypothetical protein